MAMALYRSKKCNRSMQGIFKAMDADKNGKVTLEEIQLFFRGQ